MGDDEGVPILQRDGSYRRLVMNKLCSVLVLLMGMCAMTGSQERTNEQASEQAPVSRLAGAAE